MTNRYVKLDPWNALPFCRDCGEPFGQTEGLAKGQISCLLCGYAWEGTEEELAEAARANAAWDAELARQEQEAKEAREAMELQRKYQLAKEGKWW